MNEGIKVVSCEEMARIEKGGDHERYVQEAGAKLSWAVMRYVEERHLPKQVTLLAGKGNNGADAYSAGALLLDEGYRVQAYALYEQVSSLNQKFREKFRKAKGKFGREIAGLIVDGLLGTGFKGKLDKNLASLIRQVNAADLPVISIDIPSGVNGTSGITDGIAIRATQTIALGLPKIGLFIEDGWKFVGKLYLADFGLSEEAMAKAEAVCYLPKRLELPKIERVRHKYQAGYVIGYGGSKAFHGAPKMAGFAALKVGAGIVRLFYPEEIGPAPLELICHHWDAALWKEALKKAKAVFIGPGLGPCKAWLKSHLKKIQVPCVIDADALIPEAAYPKGAVLTPHRGEALRLLGFKHTPKEEQLFAKAIRFCNRKKLTMVLKGAPTFVFGPGHKPVIIPRSDPGMASAGMGDVLTGMIAGLLAQGCSSYESAILAVSLHGIAGEIAAESLSSYCLTATDLIHFLPQAFHSMMRKEEITPSIS